MKIAHVLGHLEYGGAERQVLNLLNAMAHLHPTLVLLDEGRADPLLQELSGDVRVERSPCRLARFPRDVLRLARCLRRLEVDVVHSHMFWPSFYASITARLAGVPVLVTSEHGNNPWKKPWHRWLERNVISRQARVRICVSAEIKQRRRSLDGVPDHQLIVIPNGTAIAPQVPPTVGAPSRLLAVGRLVPAKDYPTLLQATRILRDRGYELELQIAGTGPLEKELRELSKGLDLVRTVHWLGDRGNVTELRRRCHIFVLSSVREGLPMVVLEAMAAGLPIVATSVGAIPDVLTTAENALLVPPGDARALADAIEKLRADPQMASRLGQAARRKAVAEFAIEAVAARHLALYSQLLGAEAA